MGADAGRAQLSQFKSSSVLTKSVGLKPGSLTALTAFTFSSYCCEIVERMVLGGGTSMVSSASRLSPGIGEGGGVVKEEEDPELLELEELMVESVSESESE